MVIYILFSYRIVKYQNLKNNVHNYKDQSMIYNSESDKRGSCNKLNLNKNNKNIRKRRIKSRKRILN